MRPHLSDVRNREQRGKKEKKEESALSRKVWQSEERMETSEERRLDEVGRRFSLHRVESDMFPGGGEKSSLDWLLELKQDVMERSVQVITFGSGR